MNRETQRYETELLTRLAELRQAKLEALGAGVNEDVYRTGIGFIRCIKDVVSIMEDVRKKIEKD